MPLTPVQYLFWLLHPLLQVGIAVMMYRRGLRDQFPFFFTYTVFQVLVVGLHFGVYHYGSEELYFDTYWVTTALSIFLGFAVIYEVFSYAIRPYPGLRDLGTMLFRWAVMLLVLITGISAAAGADSSDLIKEIINLQRAVRLVQCGLLLFVVMSANHLGLSWRNLGCGITFGFGLFAATDLVLYNLRATQGTEWNQTLSLITTGMYNVSVGLWFLYSLMPQAATVRSEVVYRPAFDRWNQAAMLIMNTNPQEYSTHSYISDIEHTVEEVLAHSKAR